MQATAALAAAVAAAATSQTALALLAMAAVAALAAAVVMSLMAQALLAMVAMAALVVAVAMSQMAQALLSTVVTASRVGSIKRPYARVPSDAEQVESRISFAGAERYDQPFSGLEFERGWLDCRQLYRNAELYEALCAQAERALARLDRDALVTSRVKAHLASCPPAAMPFTLSGPWSC